jgi:hypothetical protein
MANLMPAICQLGRGKCNHRMNEEFIGTDGHLVLRCTKCGHLLDQTTGVFVPVVRYFKVVYDKRGNPLDEPKRMELRSGKKGIAGHTWSSTSKMFKNPPKRSRYTVRHAN